MKMLKALLVASVLMFPASAMAHTALFTCFDLGDGSVECEGGFSNGQSAAGLKVVIADGSGKEISSTVLDQNSLMTFKKPAGNFTVTMDGGKGHTATVKSADIK